MSWLSIRARALALAVLCVAFHNVLAFAVEEPAQGYQQILNRLSEEVPDKALDDEERALETARARGDRSAEQMHLAAIAIILFELGNYQKGSQYMEQVLERASGQKADEAQALETLGYVHRNYLADPLKAAAYFDEAQKLFKELGRNQEAAIDLWNAGRIYLAQGEPAKALDYHTQALDLSRKIGDRKNEALNLVYLGHVCLRQSEVDKALAQYQQGLEVATQIQASNLMAAAHNGSGIIYERRQQYGEALNHYRVAVEQVESLGEELQALAEKKTVAQNNLSAYENLMAVMINLYQSDARTNHGYLKQAFEFAERARARAFLDTLTDVRADFGHQVPPQMLVRRRALRKTVSDLQAKLQSVGGSDEERRQWAENLKKAEDAYQQLKAEVRKDYPSYAQLYYPAPYTMERAQKELLKDDQTALLDYVLGIDRSYLWIVTKGTVYFRLLPGRSEIEQLLASFYQEASVSSDAPTLAEVSGKLYTTLITPLEENLKGTVTKLIIVPDGALYYLPFEALAKPGTKSLEPGTKIDYLIRQYTVSYAPSVSALGLIANIKRQKKETDRVLLAFADAVYRDTARSRAAKAESLARGRYEDIASKYAQLPSAIDEINRIGSLFPLKSRRLLVREHALEREAKREDVRQFKLVHFATLGLIDEGRPARSVLLLTPDETDDGLLELREVFSLPLDADLVILSACQTGLGIPIGGDGLVGLVRAFLYAGASSVVVSLWNVTDPSTVELMAQFYEQLQRGQSKAEALRQAKLTLIESKKYANLFMWAPFILVGEPDARLVLPGARRPMALIVGILLAIFVILVGVKFYLRRSRLG